VLLNKTLKRKGNEPVYILTLSSKEIILGCIHVFKVTSYMLRSCGQGSNICYVCSQNCEKQLL